MLLYESSACLHGRRQVLKGRYYASAFSHYQPVDRAVWNYTIQVSLLYNYYYHYCYYHYCYHCFCY